MALDRARPCCWSWPRWRRRRLLHHLLRHRRASSSACWRLSTSPGPQLGAAAAVFRALGRLAAAVPQRGCCSGCSSIRRRPPIDTLVGEIGIGRSKTLPPGAVGRVELRGTVWSARNAAAVRRSPRGARCRVVRVDGLTAARRARRSPLMNWQRLDRRDCPARSSSLIVLAKTAVVVPQQSAFVVERLGRFQRHAAGRASTS